MRQRSALIGTCSMSSSATTTEELKALYQKIAHQAIECTCWPASDSFVKLLDYHPEAPVNKTGINTETYQATRFDDGHGPFGVVALVTAQHNPAAVPMIATCQDVFDAFVQELVLINQPLHVIPRTKVPHFCVFLVHEHPSLLTPQQVESTWQPVDDALMQKLVDDLSTVIADSVKDAPICLELPSVLLTADGAMIAGFVERIHDEDSPTAKEVYASLKQACIRTVKKRLGGELTSRPKNLIHVTLGRVLGFGEVGAGTNKHEQQVQELVRRYNELVLPELVDKIKRSEPHAGVFRLQHLSMLRNNVWFCDENTIYETWELPAGGDE